MVNTSTDKHTHLHRHIKRSESSPTALLLRGEVDLEVIRVIVDVQEAAALIEFTDTVRGNNAGVRIQG